MYKKFSKESMEIMAAAYDEAERLGDNAVSSEHVLLAFLKSKNTSIYTFLKSNGLSYRKVLRMIKRSNRNNYQSRESEELEPTSRLKKIMKMGYEEARQDDGESKIEPAHLLISILEEGNGKAAAVLSQFDITASKTRSYFSMSTDSSKRKRKSMELKLRSTEKGEGDEGILEEFGRDLIAEAQEGNLDPVIGRENEIRRLVQTISRRKKNNPVLIGEAGVGKTAIVEGLAQKIAAEEVPQLLSDKKLFEVDMAAMVAGTKYRGEFEQRLKTLINKVTNQDNIILFIDELSTVVGAGGAEGAIDASSILKPPLASGAIQCVGTATLDDYRKSVEKDPALKRRFKTIMVEEPSIEETLEILKGLRQRYENHHHVTITDDALYQAARLSDRYVTDQFLPDKAIDLIDETAAKVRLRSFNLPPEAREISRERGQIREEEEKAIKDQDYEKAAELRDGRQKLTKELNRIQGKETEENQSIVEGDNISEMVSSWTGVPVGHLQQEERERMVDMEEKIHKRLIGQHEAVKTVSQSIRRAYSGIKDPHRPAGAFMFLGPTGVGKTELSKTLAEFLFGDEEALIRVDMSEYMERFNVSRLTGAPPGYVGYEEAGKLTEEVRHRPHSVILFDEIEKAHKDVFNILLQVMEDGILTDSQGRRVDFRNTVLIMTSNIGGKLITDKTSLGFNSQEVDSEETYQDMKDKVMGEVKDVFRPEFLNRLDDIVVFHQLTKREVHEIADLMLEELRIRLVEEHGLDLELTEKGKELLVREGYNPKYGARPMRRAIERLIENKISDRLLKGDFVEADRILVDAKDDRIVTQGIDEKSTVGVSGE
ncbi:MAG: ATP-dependent Clp protease ATP-binding subunit [Candidatus Acetothermia bacterium]